MSGKRSEEECTQAEENITELNPEQQPQSKLTKIEKVMPPKQNRLKFRYKVVEKPKYSAISVAAGLACLILLLGMMGGSYLSKLRMLEETARVEQDQCRADYEKNKCDKGLKATLSYCDQKRRCFQAEPGPHFQSKIKNSYLVGEVLRDFADGAGLYVCLGLIGMLWLVVQRNPPKEVTREYHQYFQ